MSLDDQPADDEARQPALAGARMLLADTQKNDLETLSRIFRNAGAQLHLAAAGDQVLKLLTQSEPFDILLMEIVLPRVNGLAILQALKKAGMLEKLAVIVHTKVTDRRLLREIGNYKPDRLLLKPAPLPSIFDAVREVWSSRQVKVSSGASALGYPLEFGGFPQWKTYALRLGYLRCPFDETTFSAPRLINRALKAAENDKYALGLYAGAMEKEFLEYSLTEQAVCPVCLYTADRTGFYRIKATAVQSLDDAEKVHTMEWDPVFFLVDDRVRKIMEQSVQTRYNLAKRADDDGAALFRLSEITPAWPRLPADNLVTLDLAMVCADTLAKAYSGENQARFQHKLAGVLLRKAHCFGLMARAERQPFDPATCDKKRVEALQLALKAILAVNHVELRNLLERLRCLNRRFHLADELIGYTEDESRRKKLATLRKKAYADMKSAFLTQRNENPEKLPVVERFLEPLENRMYDLEKTARKAKRRELQTPPAEENA